MQGKKFDIPTSLLKLCCVCTIFYWLFPQQMAQYVFYSPNSTLFEKTVQLLISPLTASDSRFSPQALFDLGFTCFFLRLFSSFIVSFLGEKRFFLWYLCTLLGLGLFLTPFLTYPVLLSNGLLMGMATLFCSLSSGRPIFIAIFPLPPRQIFILATIGWIAFPLLLQDQLAALVALIGCLINLGMIKFWLKQPISFF